MCKDAVAPPLLSNSGAKIHLFIRKETKTIINI